MGRNNKSVVSKIVGKPIYSPSENDFESVQLDIFQSLLCNNESEREQLSNTFDLWDSIPAYSVSRQQMAKLRDERGNLSLQRISFHYRKRPYEVIIQAAKLSDDITKTESEYYPSANEQLIEDALRKIAAEPNHGFYNKIHAISGVVFSLNMLREELKKRGHTRSYQQVVLSLKILAGSNIEIITKDEKGGEGFTKISYISGLTAVSKTKLMKDPEARWLVHFHPLITQAMTTMAYKQFNYAKMMSHQTQLARWLNKQLSLKFTFASLATTFDMRYSTIRRDSALLSSYTRERAAVVALDSAWEELKNSGVLMKVDKTIVSGVRGKLEDVVYTLTASLDFIAEMKASNKRDKLAEGKVVAIGGG
jgi:hypothetical protein